MTKTKQEQDWISQYRQALHNRRQKYYHYTQLPSVARDALRKYTSTGEAKHFDGWSIVYFFSPKHEVTIKLQDLTDRFHTSHQAVGMASKFAFLPAQTYHATLMGIVTQQSTDMSPEIIARVKACFNSFHDQKLVAPRIRIRGDISPDGSTVIAPIEPSDKASLETLYSVRSDIRKSLRPLGEQFVRNKPQNFHGHISLAYMIKPFAAPEYAKFKEIFRSFEHEDILGELTLNTITLHHFKNMEVWEDPVLQMSFPE